MNARSSSGARASVVRERPAECAERFRYRFQSVQNVTQELADGVEFLGTKSRPSASCAGGRQSWGYSVISRRYLRRQASTLIQFAKSTNNPQLAAVLIQKAANLKSRVEETAPPDTSLRAPDVEPPT
jgi:hypothetical protein